MELLNTKDVAEIFNITTQGLQRKLDKKDIVLFKALNNQRYKYYIPKEHLNFNPNKIKTDTKVITFNNLKGGVGKTTVAINLATILASMNKKILLIDIDPQCNATTFFINPKEVQYTIKEIIDMYADKKQVTTQDVKNSIYTISYDDYSFDLMPSKLSLAKATETLKQSSNTAVLKLNSIISLIKSDYDFIIIDTPPNASIIMQMALYSTDMIIPVTILEQFSIDSMIELFDEINLIQDEINEYKEKQIHIHSIIANGTKAINLHKALLDSVIQITQDKQISHLYNIPNDTKIAEAQLLKIPLCSYKAELDAGAKALEPLLNLAIDLIKGN